MKYKKVDTYKIDIIKFRDIDNSSYLRELSSEELTIISTNFPVCIKDIHNEFQKIKFALTKVLNLNFSGTKFQEYYQNTQKLILNAENDFEQFEKS